MRKSTRMTVIGRRNRFLPDKSVSFEQSEPFKLKCNIEEMNQSIKNASTVQRGVNDTGDQQNLN